MGLKFNHYRLLVLLLLADAVFVALHVVYAYTEHLPSRYFSLSYPGSYAEFFQYTKELWIAALFVMLAVRRRKAMYGVLALLFLYLLFDDSFEFHESFGAEVAEFFNFQPALGLRAVDFGELAVSGIVAGLFVAALVTAYMLADAPARRAARITVALVGLLVFFGVFLDMVEVINKSREASMLLRIIEEGGELVVMSAITWFVYRADELAPPLARAGDQD